MSAVYNLDPAARRRRPARLQDLSLRRSAIHGAQRSHRQRLRTRRDCDLDLPWPLSRWRPSARFSGAFRPIPVHNPLRFNLAFNPNGKGETAYTANFCDAERAEAAPLTRTRSSSSCRARTLTPLALQQPANVPFLQNPTTCDTPLSSSLDVLSYDGGTDHRRISVAADDRLRSAQLQPEPLRAADHDRYRLCLRHRRQSDGSPAAEPDDPLADRVARRDRHPARGLFDQSQCRRRQDLLLRLRQPTSAPPWQPTAPSSPRSAASQSKARHSRVPCRVSSTSANRYPGNRYRIFLVADGFATHIKLAGTVTPDPSTGQLEDQLQRTAAESAYRLQHALLRFRTWASRHPDPVRDLSRGPVRSHPGTRASGRRAPPNTSPSPPAPMARPARRATGPFNPEFRGRVEPATRRARTLRSRSN